ncbi:crotonobetainyl-CoA:carnitine CoA-transferase CaiB-like acyl-CoA transferase [Pseudonocardia hierapolitana]|uniref:Crotonobetainyl-CoA:carnitine CoA-transferase CaiB-like acyl-CoA transferase n=1 Tax=Pseudonocardia hierapolitana TaxID=1128676 RepID=A0A561SZW7_9PSEU|nr:CoA transferase [Pseudonocardia hierapolitana]TWF80409.1 crotonobetainyl-CoA:carnitine CoA-transferase CaiB-like acyl-CoA transferase [Pseudonocardia hierapolitana]
MFDTTEASELPLSGVRVVDAATIYAGPMIATLLGDFGADVVKVEHPRGDGLRSWAWHKDGESLWWALVGRNKRAITLALSDPRGADLLRQLLAETDVFVESFRPGTLERWGLAPDDLLRVNPRLVVVRVSGFGQTGPYRTRPGFGTLAEAISGFADTNGQADGPPVLPQWPLADGVAALAGAFATMTALRHAERTGEGQVVDLSIYEPLFWILGAQTTAHDQLGIVPSRQGSRTAFNVPRECYRTRDGRWVALSGATTATGRRILRAVGRDDLADAPWFDEITGRIAHRDEIDEAIASWVADRDNDEVLATFEAAGATVGPVYSIADIATDPHFDERGSITTVEHPALGPLRMQGLIANLTRTPGRIRTPGPLLGEHNDEILRDLLGCPPDELARLVSESVVGPSGTRPEVPSPEPAPDAPSVRTS